MECFPFSFFNIFQFRKLGKGAYLCKNKACLEKAKKTRKVERSFVQMFPPETYKEMEDALTRKVQELTDDLPESR